MSDQHVALVTIADHFGHFLGADFYFESFVGMDAPFVGLFGFRKAVNVFAVGTFVTGGCQFQGTAAVFHFDDVLDAAFAPGPLADDDGPMMILQAGGHDFAGAGAVAIDEDHDRKTFERAGLFGLPSPFGRVATLGADNPPLGDEHVADFDGRSKQAAGIESQIDDQSFQSTRFEILHGALRSCAVSRLKAVMRM